MPMSELLSGGSWHHPSHESALLKIQQLSIHKLIIQTHHDTPISNTRYHCY